jgi:hypothetical protein
MGDRAGRAARRAARLENQAGVDVDIRRDVDGGDSGSGSSDDERVEEVVRVPRGRAQPPRAVPALAMDPGMWLNMVNVKPPYLVDLEIESMKKFILEYKRYAQKCPRQLLRSMQQFVLEEHLEIICSESGEEMEQFIDLAPFPLYCVCTQRIPVANGDY